jgi:hypothetical protein
VPSDYLPLFKPDSRERPPAGEEPPRRNSPHKGEIMYTKPDSRQREFLRKRGMNPDDYVVVRALYGSLWVKNIHTGIVKILNKAN